MSSKNSGHDGKNDDDDDDDDDDDYEMMITMTASMK